MARLGSSGADRPRAPAGGIPRADAVGLRTSLRHGRAANQLPRVHARPLRAGRSRQRAAVRVSGTDGGADARISAAAAGAEGERGVARHLGLGAVCGGLRGCGRGPCRVGVVRGRGADGAGLRAGRAGAHRADSRRASAGEQGALLGTAQSASSLTRIIGPVWAGAVFDHIGTGAPYWSGALFSLVAAFWAFHATHGHRVPAREQAAAPK